MNEVREWTGEFGWLSVLADRDPGRLDGSGTIEHERFESCVCWEETVRRYLTDVDMRSSSSMHIEIQTPN